MNEQRAALNIGVKIDRRFPVTGAWAMCWAFPA
jgi:hypothetical protein